MRLKILSFAALLPLAFTSPAHSQATQVVAVCGAALPATPAVGSANGPYTVDQTGKLCTSASATVTVPTPTVVIATPLAIDIPIAAQVVSGAYSDGALVELGALADTAYAGSGASSVIAVLKGIYTAVKNSSTTVVTPLVVIGNGQNATPLAVTVTPALTIATPTVTIATPLIVAGDGATATPLAVTVTNVNANGQATMANSSPVAIASDQSALAIKTTSGTIVSGSFAAGSIASGADVTEGAPGQSASCAAASLSTMISCLYSVYSAVTAAIPTGTNQIGWTVVQSQPAAGRNFPGCTVATGSTSCLSASTATQFLQIQNTNASASIACRFGATPSLNSTSSVQLAAGQSASWNPITAGVPTGQLNCIASTASSSLYVEWL